MKEQIVKVMGKRRKPSRKPNYQSLESIKAERMAGELGQIIDQLISDPKLILQSKAPFDPMSGSRDVHRDVLNERQRLNKELAAAGLNMPGVGGLHRPTEVLGTYLIPGTKVIQPGPIVVQEGPIERRIMTDFKNNPITNSIETQVARERDGTPFVVEYGRQFNYPTLADEYIAQRIIERAGYITQKNPDKGGVPDFYATLGNETKNVDATTGALGTTVISPHLFTNLYPAQLNPGMNAVETVKEDIERGKKVGLNVIEAIDNMGFKYATSPSYTTSGKIIQASQNRAVPQIDGRGNEIINIITPEQRYDSLLLQEYPRDVWKGRNGNQRPSQVSTAPSNIESIDLKVALEAVKRNMQTQTNVFSKRGVKNNRERVEIQPSLRKDLVIDGNPLVRDMLTVRPDLGQFLNRNSLQWLTPPLQ